MNTNFVILALMEGNEAKGGISDDQILAAAKRFQEAVSKVAGLLDKAGDDLISGSPQTIYLKRMGHRALSSEDVEKIIKTVGSDADKRAFVLFEAAQHALTKRMKTAKAKGIILAQAKISLPEWRRRVENPLLWKPEQIEKIVEVLKRIGV